MFKTANGFKEFFQKCIHDSFQSLYLRKFSKQAEKFEGIFSKGVLMIIFKIYTPKKVRNKQTAPKKKKSKMYSWIFSSSTLKKNFENIQTTSKNCFNSEFKVFFGKKSAFRKSFERHQGKVLIFWYQRKLGNHLK